MTILETTIHVIGFSLTFILIVGYVGYKYIKSKKNDK